MNDNYLQRAYFAFGPHLDESDFDGVRASLDGFLERIHERQGKLVLLVEQGGPPVYPMPAKDFLEEMRRQPGQIRSWVTQDMEMVHTQYQTFLMNGQMPPEQAYTENEYGGFHRAFHAWIIKHRKRIALYEHEQPSWEACVFGVAGRAYQEEAMTAFLSGDAERCIPLMKDAYNAQVDALQRRDQDLMEQLRRLLEYDDKRMAIVVRGSGHRGMRERFGLVPAQVALFERDLTDCYYGVSRIKQAVLGGQRPSAADIKYHLLSDRPAHNLLRYYRCMGFPLREATRMAALVFRPEVVSTERLLEMYHDFKTPPGRPMDPSTGVYRWLAAHGLVPVDEQPVTLETEASGKPYLTFTDLREDMTRHGDARFAGWRLRLRGASYGNGVLTVGTALGISLDHDARAVGIRVKSSAEDAVVHGPFLLSGFTRDGTRLFCVNVPSCADVSYIGVRLDQARIAGFLLEQERMEPQKLSMDALYVHS